MTVKGLLYASVAAATLITTAADAATINLIDLGGVAGSPAQQGFQIAANYWGAMLSNNVSINLGVSFAALDAGIIGSTGSRRLDYSTANWETRLNASKSNSKLDQAIKLPTLSGGGASFITNGVDADGNDDVSKLVYNNGQSASSQTLYMNSSVIKAIGGTVSNGNVCSGASQATLAACDGRVTFSSNFNFDFNPADGVNAGTFDFIGVAIHEIGHALGFVSGVDFLDYYGGPNGPGAGTLGYSLNDTSIYSALDMFRYSTDPTGIAPGSGPTLDLAAGTGEKYFSIDGGATALFGNSFATGSYNGDGDQASHWKDASGANRCGPQIGIMDPTFCYGQQGEVTSLDLAAFDAMGWNLSVDALANRGGYSWSTGQIYYAFGGYVPEPATWAMMIAGFGLVGGAMRRRVTKVGFTTA